MPPQGLRLGVTQDSLGRHVPARDPPVDVEREDRVVLDVLHERGELTLGLSAAFLCDAPFRDVLDRQEDQPRLVALPFQAAGVQDHDPAAEGREVVLDLEPFEWLVLGEHFLQQAAEAGDVPLAVAQVVQEAAPDILGGLPEVAVEGAVGRPHAEVAVQDQERLPHRFHDRLGEGDCVPVGLFDPKDDVGDLAVGPEDGGAEQVPVERLEPVALCGGAADLEPLRRHRPGGPVPQHPLQRGAEGLHVRRGRAIGVIGEHLQEFPALDLFPAGRRGAEVVIGSGDNSEARVDGEEQAGDRLEKHPEIRL